MAITDPRQLSRDGVSHRLQAEHLLPATFTRSFAVSVVEKAQDQLVGPGAGLQDVGDLLRTTRWQVQNKHLNMRASRVADLASAWYLEEKIFANLENTIHGDAE